MSVRSATSAPQLEALALATLGHASCPNPRGSSLCASPLTPLSTCSSPQWLDAANERIVYAFGAGLVLQDVRSGAQVHWWGTANKSVGASCGMPLFVPCPAEQLLVVAQNGADPSLKVFCSRYLDVRVTCALVSLLSRAHLWLHDSCPAHLWLHDSCPAPDCQASFSHYGSYLRHIVSEALRQHGKSTAREQAWSTPHEEGHPKAKHGMPQISLNFVVRDGAIRIERLVGCIC
jgi:hypothetical protein